MREDLSEIRLKLSELSLSPFNGSFFFTDALFSFSLFLLLVETLLFKFELHLGFHASLSFLSIFLGISIGLLGGGFSSEGLNLSLELGFHLGTLGFFSSLFTLHFLCEFIQLLLSFSLHSSLFFGLLLGVILVILGGFLFHGKSEGDLGIIGHGLTSTVFVLVEEYRPGTETDSIVRLEINTGHIGHALPVNENMFHSLGC